jgi:hypothetical protein
LLKEFLIDVTAYLEFGSLPVLAVTAQQYPMKMLNKAENTLILKTFFLHKRQRGNRSNLPQRKFIVPALLNFSSRETTHKRVLCHRKIRQGK